MRKVNLFLSAILLFSLSCGREFNIHTIETTRLAMDTVVQISIFYSEPLNPKAREALEAAFKTIDEIEQLTSTYQDSSEVSRVNRLAGKQFQRVSPQLIQVITEAQKVSELSNGAFDITVAPLLRLWNFHSENHRLPSDTEIAEKQPLVNYKNILIQGDEIGFQRPGMGLDLGGIAKGYAIDQAIKVLQDYGIKDAMVNAGGDLRTISSPLTRGKRKVWIRHPRNKGQFFGYFKMDTGSVATSGDYERFFMVDSVRYHHILDPKTGFPAGKCISATIQTDTAIRADALATAVFVLGPEEGMKLIERLPDVEGVIIYETRDKLEWKVSEGLVKTLKVLTK
ncbi:MAG: FAD:protein FMN transferase [candidate division KSB1 bacterium]|nr:FAD:protein FMN transferase [candidate division KSB1 bacterium]